MSTDKTISKRSADRMLARALDPVSGNQDPLVPLVQDESGRPAADTPARVGPVNILLLEDSAEVASETVSQLREQGLEVEWEHVQTADAYGARLDSSFDAIIADYHIPGDVVRAVLAITLRREPDTPFVVISAAISNDEGVELMRLGARDFFHKGSLEALGASLLQRVARAREQRKARSIESRYRTLFEHLPVGVARSLFSGETLDINPALLRITGFPDEATYRHEMTTLESLEAGARSEMSEALARDGGVSGFETQVKRRDGSSIWVRLDISVIPGETGAPAFYDTVVTDIDDRRRAEADLRTSDTQRRLLLSAVITAQEAERQRIAQGIHDDAVQVMSAANLHLDMLGRKLDNPELRAEVDGLIESVSLSTDRLRGLLFELQPPALERSGLMAALRDQLQLLCRDTGAADCALTGRLTTELSSDRGILVYRMAQEAFANIRKHAQASRVDVAVGSENGGVLVRIHDNGGGFVPPQPRETTPGHMGLASMTQRAALVGGWCRVESSPGAGTTVSLWVPFGEGAVIAAPATRGAEEVARAGNPAPRTEPSATLGGPTRVLVVEDHPMVAQALRLLLDEADDLSLVGVAENATDAVRYAQEFHPDVVVMDSHIPGGSGADAAREIRESGPSTAILFFSGDDSDSAILEAVEAGASGYLNKGSRSELVLEAMRRVASGEMLIPAALLARLIASKRSAAISAAEATRAREQFTHRELEVLALMGEGLDNLAIADRLFIERNTARWHVRNILDKLQAHSKLEAVAQAAHLGLLDR